LIFAYGDENEVVVVDCWWNCEILLWLMLCYVVDVKLCLGYCCLWSYG